MLLSRVIAVAVLSCTLLLPVAAADPLPRATEWIPQNAVACMEITRPEAVFDLLLHPELIQAVKSSPAFERQSDTKQFRDMRNLVRYVEREADTDWQTVLRRLFGGGVTLAVGPGDAVVLIVDSEDEEILKTMHNVMQFIAESEADKQNDPNRVRSVDYRGVTTWTFGPKEAHAMIGNRIVISNQPEALVAVLDRRAEPGGPSLAKSEKYQRARRAAGPNTAATVFADMTVLKQLPNVKKALAGNENPLAVLLVAGMLDGLRQSDWLTLALGAQDDTLSLALISDAAGEDSAAARFARPQKPGESAMPLLAVPRQIAAVSLLRDLHGFYAAKDDLFPERTSQLIFFENMMGIFFTGRDLTEEVLAETGSEIRLVVAQQQYDPKVGTPAVQIPSFALVMRLKNPDKFQPVMEEAWQKGLGLINFTRGQQALPGLIIDREIYGDTKYTVAYFSASDLEERSAIDTRFNLRPTLAMPGEYLILSSTDALAEDLIDSLKQEAAGTVKPLPGRHSLAAIDGRQLASILGKNREGLIRNNMVEEGNDRAEAENAIDALLMIVGRLAKVKMEMGSGADHSKATLDVQLNMAAEQAGGE